MKIKAIRTQLFREGESLEKFIYEHIRQLRERDIIAVTSKIAALGECRTAPISEKEKIIKKESEWAVPTKYAWLTMKDGMLMPSAGIDESNASGKLILLPKDSFTTAARLRAALLKHYGLKSLGVLLTDSRTLPLRAGAVGVALGYAGFNGIKDYRGVPDLFGRTLTMTRTNVADSLAASAVFLMGEGGERKPLAVIKDAPVTFRERVDRKEIIISINHDLYAPLLGKRKNTNIAKKKRIL